VTERDREVWKFKVPMGEAHGYDSTIAMPGGAEIISVGHQGADVYAWAIVNPEAAKVERRLGYFATGSPLPPNWDYVGTVHVLDADRPALGSWLVWHVFEEPA
jgi:hypothetical protein